MLMGEYDKPTHCCAVNGKSSTSIRAKFMRAKPDGASERLWFGTLI
jgi:hypothetical protein